MAPKEKTKGISFVIAYCFAVLLCSNGMTFSAESEPPPLNPKDLIAVKVYNLVEITNESPVVLLSNSDEKLAMPIWISPFEANAIYLELGGIKPYRPQTHDLLKVIIETFRGTLHYIVITHEKENVFYAKIIMEKDGSTIEVDARPSDSIVLALKFNAPIWVAKTLFAARSIPIVAENENIQKYGLTLQELSPPLAQYFSLGSISGVFISDVRKGSNAQKDGLKVKDVIVEIDNEPVKGIDTLKNILSKGLAETKAKIYRKNDFIVLTLHLKGN